MFSNQNCFVWTAVLLLVSFVSAGVIQDSVLVLYDTKYYNLADSVSATPGVDSLLKELNEGFDVVLRAYDDDSELVLLYNDQLRFDHLVLLPSSKKAIKSKDAFTQDKLLDFIEANGNLIVVGGVNSVLPDNIRSFLNELGVYPSPKNFKYTDHFNSEDGSVVLSNEQNLVANNGILSLFNVTTYEGSAALVSNNEFILPLVKSSRTGFTLDSYSDFAESDKTWTFGEQGFLAVALQALNNARVTWIGSDQFLTESELINWTFQKQGVLQLKFVEHFNNESPNLQNPTLYRVKDQAIYTVGVSEFSNGRWIPYEITTEENQLQLAFKMLDPYQRIDMIPLGPALSSPEIEGGDDIYIYLANFTVPDHHGMFTFELDYKRSGLSFLSDKRIVTVRHLANDEFTRSWDITNAWVYIASAGLVVLAWFFFVINYIYVTNTDVIKKNV